MAKFFITGAAGFIGSHTVDHLLAEGHAVAGLDNLSNGSRQNLASAETFSSFHFMEEDVRNRPALEKAVARFQPDAILHLAALVSVPESLRDPDLNFEINLRGTWNVAETARKFHVPRLLCASSAAVYGESGNRPLAETESGNPVSPYSAAKLASENILSAYAASFGINALSLRYFNVYGPCQNPASPYAGVISLFAKKISEGGTITLFGDGRQTRDFIFVKDVAIANGLALTRKSLPSGPFNICTGRSQNLLAVIAILERRFSTTARIESRPPRPGDISHSSGNPEKTQKALGFTAATDLEEGLSKFH